MKPLAVLAMTISSVTAFVPTFGVRHTSPTRHVLTEQKVAPESHASASPNHSPPIESGHDVLPKKQPKMDLKEGAHGKQGIFSPLVLTLKKTMGEDELNHLRGKVITLHSEAIASFVSTSKTPFGQKTLEVLFNWADKNDDDIIEEGELEAALHSLGFSWLHEKQVEGILERADADANGVVDSDEFKAEAPRTLKRNLTKLAKKNGNDLGFLS